MSQVTTHATGEQHLVHRNRLAACCRARANDGIISVSSLIVGVAPPQARPHPIS